MTESAPPVPTPRRHRPLRRIAQVLGFGLVLCIALVAGIPFVASTGFVRTRIASDLSDVLGAPVVLEQLAVSWGGLVEVDGFGIGAPEQGEADVPVVRLRRATASFDPWALADRRLDLGLRLEGVVVQVPEARATGEDDRRVDPGTSSDVRTGDRPSPDRARLAEPDSEDLSRIRLDVELLDVRVEVVRPDGSVVEAIDVSRATLRKPFGVEPLEIVLDGSVRGPGASLHVDLRAEPSTAGSVEGTVRCDALDLGKWRPLIEPLLAPGSLDALEGVLEADLQVAGSLDAGYQTDGLLSVRAPRVAGPLLSGLDFAVPSIRIVPTCTITRTAGGDVLVDSTRARIDAGVIVVEGRPASAGKLGLSFALDLAGLAAMGGPIPPSLRGAGNSARGIVEVDLEAAGRTAIAWSELDVDFVTLDQGVREHLRGGAGTLAIGEGGRLQLEASGEIRAVEDVIGGTFALTADAAPDFSGSAHAELRLDGWDFDGQRVLLDRLVPGDQLQTLAGVVSADLTVDRAASGGITLGGEVAVRDAAVSGPAVLDMDLAGARWVLTPDVSLIVAEDGTLALERVAGAEIDLGFLRLRGAPARPGRLGMEFECDGDAIVRMGAPLPPEFAGSGLRLIGTADVPAQFDADTLLPSLVVDCDVFADRLAPAGQDLGGLRLSAGLREGELAVELREGTWNGGALRLTARSPLDLAKPPVVRLALGAEGAAVGPNVLPALEYVLPTFAGLGTSFSRGLPVTFASQLGFAVELEGPAFPLEGEPVLAWLDHWVGSGTVELAKGRFAPAAGLEKLLELTGQSGVVAFDDISSRFELAEGSIRTGLSKLSTKGAEYGFRGETRLDGTLAHAFDARALLERHRDGRKILEYLGDAPIEGRLEGSLGAPRFALPDVGELASRAAGAALEKEARGLLDKVLGPGKGKGDEAAKGVGDLLRGILGGKKKGGG